ncbi:MAG: LamG domain-containing protein [Candidatus Micrarchaeia archaeon]
MKKKEKQSKYKKLQSAIEYLTTYWWAVLIIAIVIVVLFHIGLFSTNLGPKALPGSCRVTRSYESETPLVTLQGAGCNENPEYVASTTYPTYQYWDFIVAPDTLYNATFMENNRISLSVWIKEIPNDNCELSVANIYTYPYSNGGFSNTIFRFGVSGGSGWAVNGNRAMLELFTPTSQTNMFSTVNVPYNQWINIIASYNGTYVNFYINGTFAGDAQYSATLSPGIDSVLVIGGNPNSGCRNNFQGNFSNLQIYNISLSNDQAKTLYEEGIGGAPIDLNYLVAWYPLNGNPNDYSGYNENGAAFNVIYTSLWQNGYSVP